MMVAILGRAQSIPNTTPFLTCIIACFGSTLCFGYSHAVVHTWILQGRVGESFAWATCGHCLMDASASMIALQGRRAHWQAFQRAPHPVEQPVVCNGTVLCGWGCRMPDWIRRRVAFTSMPPRSGPLPLVDHRAGSASQAASASPTPSGMGVGWELDRGF
jgi:hypothetical protein